MKYWRFSTQLLVCFILFKATYTNEDGTIGAFGSFQVEGACVNKYEDIGRIIHSPPRSIATVPCQQLGVSCIVRGIVQDPIESYWNTSLGGHSKIIPLDNSSDSYHWARYQIDLINCLFNNKLIIINTTLEMNGIVFTCVEKIEVERAAPLLFTADATLNVLKLPKVVNISVAPSTRIRTGKNISMYCQVEAAPSYADVMWLKNGSEVDKSKHSETVQGDTILSTFNISNFTVKDNGNYTCLCKYDSRVIAEGDIISNSMSVLVEDDNKDDPLSKKHQYQHVIRDVTVGGVFATLFITAIIFFLLVMKNYRKYKKQKEQAANKKRDDAPERAATQACPDPPLPISDDENESFTMLAPSIAQQSIRQSAQSHQSYGTMDRTMNHNQEQFIYDGQNTGEANYQVENAE